MIRGLALGTALLVAASLTPQGVSAQATPEYDTAIRQGLAEFEAGRWSEARALFQRALELYPNARVLRGLGMAAFEMRDYVASIGALREALEHAELPLSPQQRVQVEDLLQRSLVFVGRMQFTIDPEGATLLIDGAEPVWLDGLVLVNEGSRHVRVSHDGYRPETFRRDVTSGQTIQVEVSLVLDEPTRPVMAATETTPARSPLPVVGWTARALPLGLPPWSRGSLHTVSTATSSGNVEALARRTAKATSITENDSLARRPRSRSSASLP